MWIVQLALRRPYTFVVASLLLLIISPLVILTTPKDIFPNINIPVVSIVFQFTGMPASQFEGRITSPYERVLTTTVNDIEHIESQSLNGISVIKVYFQPKAKIEAAIAQVTAISQTILKQLPTGITPPLIITYNASTVPILQLGLSSKTLPEQALTDLGLNFVRTGLASVPGLAVPYPFGGKMPQITIDIDPNKLTARGLSPTDVVNAIAVQNLIVPSGTVKLGSLESDVEMNASPQTIPAIADLPIKSANGAILYVRDVASVRQGFQFQTNIVRQDGERGALLSIYKAGAASTLAIVDEVRARLPKIAATLPPELTIKPLFDQSIFVRASINGVLREAVIAAVLTALMILLFLGKWRHTLVICISIPLSILSAICILSALGETINIMTLGGLALAVGILVDDATVEIENIDRNLELGKDVTTAILDGAQQIALPALVSTLCICIVFVPMFFLTGVAKYLFVPLAESVVFAMLSSYVLSRTLVPTLVQYILRGHEHLDHDAPKGFFGRFQAGFERGFERMRDAYTGLLDACMKLRWAFIGGFLLVCLTSLLLLLTIGNDFFPTVDAGQFRLHVRARTSTRIEETASLADQVENYIRTVIPKEELTGVLDNIGLPYSGINTSYSNNGTIGTADVEILCSLNAEDHHPTADYIAKLRAELPKRFPGSEFFFQPADIVSQILNFGLSAPIDVQFVGKNVEASRAIAESVAAKMKMVPGAVDTHVYQLFNEPKLNLTVDRSKASQLGLTERDVANSLLVALSSSFQVAPSFYLSPVNGVSYNLAAQAPQYRIEEFQDLANLPITSTNGAPNQSLINLASFQRTTGAAVANHYDIQPVIDILASVQGRDLGGVAGDIRAILNEIDPQLPWYKAYLPFKEFITQYVPGCKNLFVLPPSKLPRGTTIELRGQVKTMRSSFIGLLLGLVGAVVLVYLLIVVNFQSWTDPFIILTGLPGALAGISWMLFLTGTALSVPALMGAIMCIGVATANSILVVTFAREQLAEHGDALRAAMQAGRTRLRPVIMTALAMMIGMVPMSLGLGEGGEQNAPLGRAVIGGLLISTVATLLFVPVIFALIRGRGREREEHLDAEGHSVVVPGLDGNRPHADARGTLVAH